MVLINLQAFVFLLFAGAVYCCKRLASEILLDGPPLRHLYSSLLVISFLM
jgi:hypothetical protein